MPPKRANRRQMREIKSGAGISGSITTVGNQISTEGNTISLQLEATDPNVDNMLAFSVEGLPPGLSISTDGLISGTIAQGAATNSPYNVIVTDNSDFMLTDEIAFQWEVEENEPPVLTYPGAQLTTEGMVINLQMTASDPNEGDTLTFEAINLPDGLSIGENDGLISGTIAQGAAENSPYNVTVTVTDDANPPLDDSAVFQWIVNTSQGEPPRIYPQNQVLIDSAEDWQPFQFSEMDGATWYRVLIMQGNQIEHDNWYDASQICLDEVCTLPDNLWLTNGTYSWWITYYGPTLTQTNSYWNETTFTVNVPLPQPPQNITVDPRQGRPLLTWDDDANALWYQLYIGGSGQTYLQWLDGTAICAEDVCSLEPEIDWPGGTYSVWLQAWGPGGFSSATGANTADSWVQGPDLSLPTTPPATPTGLAISGADSANPTFDWAAQNNATWYEMIIAPTDLSWTYSQWQLGYDLGCGNGGTCSLTDPALHGGLLDIIAGADSYNVYVRAYGPGGMSAYAEVTFDYTFSD